VSKSQLPKSSVHCSTFGA